MLHIHACTHAILLSGLLYIILSKVVVFFKQYYMHVHTFLKAFVVFHHIWMLQLFPHNLHLIQQSSQVSALFQGCSPESSVATSYLL